MAVRLGEHEVRLPRDDVRFPVELRLPDGFDVEQPSTWPRVDGRLEYVDGRLLFMPPTGDTQQDVAVDVTFLLRSYTESRPDLIVGGNEAGMLLGGDVRAADVAVWNRGELGPHTGGYRRVPPLLAVEVAGRDDDESDLRDKAKWYLANGVRTTWLVLPAERTVVVVTASATRSYKTGESLPSPAELDGLEPAVERFFTQLDR